MVRETIEQFSKLQAYDSRIFAIEAQLAKIPEMLKESRERFENVEKEKEEAETSYAEEKTALLAAEKTLAEQSSLLESAQKKLSSVHNNKEYEAVLKELDLLKKSIVDSEEIIKAKKAAVAGLEEKIAAKTTEAEEQCKAYETEKAEKEDENKALFEEVATLKKEREELTATVKKSSLSKYERIRAARHNLAIVAVSQEVCTGCNMKIPPQLAVEVKKENELLQCPYCQRFLFSEKEEAVKAS